MSKKRDIFWRINLAFLLLIVFGLVIIGQIVRIQFVEGEQWKDLARSQSLKYQQIEASRGNIYGSDGKMLAMSTPIYDVRMDTRADGLTQELFDAKIDSLAMGLAAIFGDRSRADYKQDLKRARAEGARYFLIRRNVGYRDLQRVKALPIFRMGRNKGGLLVEQRNVRVLPYLDLAARTIGTLRNVKPVGIEAAFDDYLKGVSGKRLMQRISSGDWMPVTDKDEIEPHDGNDVHTTIDVNIQDVAESSLRRHLELNKADHGCAVLMEVATGEIRAIANLSRTEGGDYVEDFNYAIAEAAEPGSTFKLASLLVALEDQLVDLQDTVEVGNGVYVYSRKNGTMRDAHAPRRSRMSVQEIFEHSSNVGVSRIIFSNYAKRPQEFVNRLRSFGLGEKLGLQIDGEGAPFIRNANEKGWSGISLPWMSIGYECLITPLQTLTFYNAVANNGRMVKPLLVKEIRHRGQLVKSFETEVMRDSIASAEALQKAHIMLEGVVQNGTGDVLKDSPYRIAGKTGTAQIAHSRFGYNKGNAQYQASFVGYFPADKPAYSCIVIVNAPSNSLYYGGAVAAPIFKEIADKVYSSRLDLHNGDVPVDSNVYTPVPYVRAGAQKDTRQVLAGLGVSYHAASEEAAWVSATRGKDEVELQPRRVAQGAVPNVIGMGLKDALYLLESSGLLVRVTGKGSVTRQSIGAGTPVRKGQQIVIELG
ncbi:MAG: penicillin-binding transpeptidase domain-containing protein [Bacteroidota bacterium]|jgi:cell division protein FtsI (penicillin-binding protein 3)|nr:transpeptidase family protein [Bacteroidia bacterium]